MNKAEYMSALTHALSGLPPEEQQSALRYYEDYFADAGTDNEAQVIAGLGAPEAVAQLILNDYCELIPSQGTGAQGDHDSSTWHEQTASGAWQKAKDCAQDASQGIKSTLKSNNIWWKILLIFLFVCVVIPVIAGLFSGVVGLLAGLLAGVAGVLLAGVVVFVVGVALFILGLFSIFVNPAYGVLMCGGGLVMVAVGMVLTALTVKLLHVCVPYIRRLFTNCVTKFKNWRNAR